MMKRFCGNCTHHTPNRELGPPNKFMRHVFDKPLCGAVGYHPVTGRGEDYCSDMRAEGGQCGPSGKLFSAKGEAERTTLNPKGTKGEAERTTLNPKDAQGAAKPQLWLNPPSALRAMARAMGEGAAKYGAYNWRENEVREDVYISAALRHIAAYQDGERADPDSGHHPLAHAMASLAILIDGESNGLDETSNKGEEV